MKKLLTVLSIAFTIAIIAPSCSSSDENFEDISTNAELDQKAPPDPDGGNGRQPGD